MQQQRVHQNDVARSGNIFHLLQRYAVNFLDAIMKAGNTCCGVTGCAEVTQVRMSLQRLT
jgi:hypothetical protein